MPNFRKTNLLSASLVVALFAAAGCTYNDDKTKPTTKPADNALRDPYGKWTTVDTDISGGGSSNLNRDAIHRDVDNFLLK